MSTTEPRRTVPGWALASGVLVVAVAGLVWAKWAPYWGLVVGVGLLTSAVAMCASRS